MQKIRSSVNLQHRFAKSDDVAVMLASTAGDRVEVDASQLDLGVLLELLILKRGTTDRTLAVSDSSRRGKIFRRLLQSSHAYLNEGSIGVLRRGTRKDNGVAAYQFAEAFREQLVAAGVFAHAALRLSGALYELLDNVGEHAGEDADGLGAFEVLDREAWMVVADSGQGVLKSYQKSPISEKPADAESALKWAVIEHRSCTGNPGRGTGFLTVIDSVRSLDGCLRVRSDAASIELEQKADYSNFLLREQGHLRGFVVSVLLRW